MKRILEVLIPDHEFAEGPEVAVVEISETLKARVLELAQAVKLLGVEEIRDFTEYPEFFMRDRVKETEDNPIVPRPPADENEEFCCRVEFMRLAVSAASEFYWTGYIKNTEVRIETKAIPLAELGTVSEPAPSAIEALKKVEASICTGSINDPAIQQVALKDIRKALLRPQQAHQAIGQGEPGTLAVVIEGGQVAEIISNRPCQLDHLRVMVIDYDTEGMDRSLLTCLPQGDGTTAPAWVRACPITPAQVDLDAAWEAANK